MAALVNHPGFWLSQPAADSLERLERRIGVIDVNSAGRTVAEQQAIINRYDHPKSKYDRPPYLYNPARPADASNHVKSGGIAIDSSDIDKMLKYGPDHGWFRNYAYDKVHFEYNAARDKYRVAAPAAGTSNAKLKEIQNFLNHARGEKLVVDGKSGILTTAAIKRYQKFLKTYYGYKGELDGKWGNGTQSAHNVYYAKWSKVKPAASVAPTRPVLKAGSIGQQVKDLQNIFNKYYPSFSKLKVDGSFGPATVQVVKEFQSRSGLKVDGIVGSTTWHKLGQ